MDETLPQVLLNRVFEGLELRLRQEIKLNHWKLGVRNQVDRTIVGLMWWELLGLFLPKHVSKICDFQGKIERQSG